MTMESITLLSQVRSDSSIWGIAEGGQSGLAGSVVHGLSYAPSGYYRTLKSECKRKATFLRNAGTQLLI